MRALKSLLAAVLAVVMIVSLSVSAFAAYEEITYDDVSEMYGTTLAGVNTLYIKFVDKLGIIPSLTDGSFNPTAMITRADALKIAYRMLHYDYDELADYASTNTDFDEANGGDINDVHTLKPYIAWAQDYQLINSEYVPDSKFEPTANITGEEFITLIAKVLSIADGTSTAEDYETALEVVLMDSELNVSSESVNREQAAVVVARAMLFDVEYGDISEEMFIYFSDYNLNCLATKVYGCMNTELIIRATKQRPMDYENVISDVLFSNGVQLDIGADMSSYVGWPLEIIFMDKDGSGTLTQEEEIITYQFVSPWVDETTLSALTIESYAAIKGTAADTSTFKLQTNSLLYLNDHLWPADHIYDLTSLVDYIEFAPNTTNKPATTILNRPNLKFTFMRYSSAENAGVVFASEWIPGKIMTITDDYISVYSYYDNVTHIFEDNYVEMTSLANPSSGDYVNYYIAGDKLYLTAGTTAYLEEYNTVTSETDGEVLSVPAEDNGMTVTYKKHLFYNTASKTPANLSGPVIAILDETRETYLALEEAKATKEVAVEISSANVNAEDDTYADIEATTLAGEDVKLKVKIDNISTITGVIDQGDFYTYYETEGGDIIMNAIDPVTMNVIETEDYFITKGGQKYLKTESFDTDNDAFYNGTATLLIDKFDGVWGVRAA